VPRWMASRLRTVAGVTVRARGATAGPGYPRNERLALRLIGINDYLWLADAHNEPRPTASGA
jgi:hypothetical protein